MSCPSWRYEADAHRSTCEADESLVSQRTHAERIGLVAPRRAWRVACGVWRVQSRERARRRNELVLPRKRSTRIQSKVV